MSNYLQNLVRANEIGANSYYLGFEKNGLLLDTGVTGIVVPLEIRGGVALVGEDVATALADALNTTDSVIATVATSSDSAAKATWPDSAVSRLARSRRTRYAVTGRVTPDANPRLEIQVHDFTSGSRCSAIACLRRATRSRRRG
jgi:hypothetical protein